MYYNRRGQSIDVQEWARLFEDREYQVLLKTAVGDQEVSTVWLGLDHGHVWLPEHQPLIFETMVFPDCDIVERYATEDEARAGHARLVEQLS